MPEACNERHSSVKQDLTVASYQKWPVHGDQMARSAQYGPQLEVIVSALLLAWSTSMRSTEAQLSLQRRFRVHLGILLMHSSRGKHQGIFHKMSTVEGARDRPLHSHRRVLTSRACSWRTRSRTWAPLPAGAPEARPCSFSPTWLLSHPLSRQTPGATPATCRNACHGKNPKFLTKSRILKKHSCEDAPVLIPKSNQGQADSAACLSR